MKSIVSLAFIYLFLLSAVKAADFPEIEGWQPDSDVSTYNPATLYEYINGGADQFISYGFQMLQSRDIAKDGVVVTVDIYDMGTPLNAFGVYKTEKPRDRKPLAIGAESVMFLPYQILLLKDRYYVKINVLEGDLTDASGEELLIALDKALPGTNEFPKGLSVLPQEGRLAGTEGFVREAFLGLSELTNCLYAEYAVSGNEFKYFMMTPVGEKTTAALWQVLANKWQKSEHSQFAMLVKNIPYSGLAGVLLRDDTIIGVTDCVNEGELMERLDKFLH